MLRDVRIADSRDWFPGAEVSTYFGLLEQKCISNAVDATNFAWLATGQPTHAFDLDKIEGGIIVRRAEEGRAAEDSAPPCRRGHRISRREYGEARGDELLVNRQDDGIKTAEEARRREQVRQKIDTFTLSFP